MIEIKELNFKNSEQFLDRFQRLENSYGADWYDCEEERAKYIWLIEDIDNPLGFLSYKILLHPNQIDFIYIVKIYVLKGYKKYKENKEKEPILIEGKRVSEILFEKINKKGVNILTLESIEELDTYYEKLGFEYNEEMSNFFAPIIGTKEPIMSKIIRKPEVPDNEKDLFGG